MVMGVINFAEWRLGIHAMVVTTPLHLTHAQKSVEMVWISTVMDVMTVIQWEEMGAQQLALSRQDGTVGMGTQESRISVGHCKDQ